MKRNKILISVNLSGLLVLFAFISFSEASEECLDASEECFKKYIDSAVMLTKSSKFSDAEKEYSAAFSLKYKDENDSVAEAWANRGWNYKNMALYD